MIAFFAIVRVTLKQLLGGPAVIVWLSTANRTPSRVFETYHDAAIATLFLIVTPIVSIVLGSAALGDERRDGTLSFLIVRPIPRAVITGAKLTAAWVASVVVVGMAGGLASGAASIRMSDWSTFVPTIVGLAISAACYSAVFLVLGHVTSRAVLMGLVYLFVWETGVSLAAASLANVSLFRIGLTAYAAMVPEARQYLADPLGSLAPGVGGALAKTLVLGTLAVFGSAAMLRRRDIT
jgi:ABC-2 type transport system permease protein